LAANGPWVIFSSDGKSSQERGCVCVPETWLACFFALRVAQQQTNRWGAKASAHRCHAERPNTMFDTSMHIFSNFCCFLGRMRRKICIADYYQARGVSSVAAPRSHQPEAMDFFNNYLTRVRWPCQTSVIATVRVNLALHCVVLYMPRSGGISAHAQPNAAGPERKKKLALLATLAPTEVTSDYGWSAYLPGGVMRRRYPVLANRKP